MHRFEKLLEEILSQLHGESIKYKKFVNILLKFQK